MKTQKPYKFPKTIGACADRIYELRASRLEAKKKVDAIEAEEKALKEHIINTLPKSETSGVAGKIARVAVVRKSIPEVQNWDEFWKGFNKARDKDLFTRSLNTAAIQARWDAGKKVPGVGVFNAVSLSITKV